MRVRWNAMNTQTNFLLKEEDVKKKIEMTQIKRQIEILSTFMPDQILNMTFETMSEIQQFVGVLLFADVSGFTPLCEKYNKTGKGGIYRLTATLNAYIGAIVEVIYFYGGDVLKFSGDAFLAAWKVDTDVCLFEVIHEVIVCALFIQENLGRFETEVNVLLKVKLAIACGNMTFSVIGDDTSRHYVILGEAVNDVKDAEHCSVSGDVVIAPCAWGHVSEESYDVTYAEHGNVKVWRCLYKPHELPIKEMYENKRGVVLKLCEQHISHRSHLHQKKTFDESLTDSKITELFVRSLPPRAASKRATQAWITNELRQFIIKPVLDQVEEKQPLEYLTEMREVTIQFINIVPSTYFVPKLVEMIDEAYKIVCHIVSKLLGIVNKVSLFDKDAMMLVLFGLRGIKHEFESQNALKSAFRIRKEINKLDCVKSVSVGVTNGLVYCGVVGHPLRREYTVIGGSVNKAARIMCAYPQKVTCDHQTYKNSKLSSAYFQLQSALKLKGIEDAGHIFEYNEDFECETKTDHEETPIIGRQEEMDLIHMVVNHPQHCGGYHGLCIKGKSKIGKSKVLRAAAVACKQEGHEVASLDLACGAQRPYFAVSALYKQLYDEKTTVDNPSGLQITHLPRNLWSYLDAAQIRSDDTVAKKKKNAMTDCFWHMLKASKTGKTVLIIDNVHHIDSRSREMILASLEQRHSKFICAGQFDEEATWDNLFKFSLCRFMKTIEIEPLNAACIPDLICSFLKVDGVPKKLTNLIEKTCEGRPGWIQSCLLRLINTGAIEVNYAKNTDQSLKKYVFSDPNEDKFEPVISRKEKKRKEVVCVIELFDKYNESTEELTLTAISLDLFDSFTPYQQLVIKTASVLGEVFTRTLMIVMLKYPQEHLFAATIKQLFEEDVFDCGSRYIHSGGLFSRTLCCMCFMNQDDFDDVNKFDLPKYAFCKVIHFKNKSLKAVAYELLPANQKKELHLRITDVLDNQNNACPTCLRDNSAAIMNFRRFKDIIHAIDERPMEEIKTTYDVKLSCSAEEIKNIIREGIHKYTNEEEMLNDPEARSTLVPVRKVYDPTVCFCLEIMTRVYADLVYHSECAGHLGKRVFFLLQYSKILILMNDFKDAITLLNEASELFTIDFMSQYISSEKFRKYNIAKIHLLLCEAHISLKEYEAARNHVCIALRMYNVPMLSLKYKLVSKILFHSFVLGSDDDRLVIRKRANPIWYYDIGQCLNMISIIAAAQNNWELAKIAAGKAIKTMSVFNPNVSLLCDTYSNAIELHSFLGDQHTCEVLERCINRRMLQFYTHGFTVEMLSLNKLISVFFLSKVMSGNLCAAIRVGYRSLEINRTIQTYYLENEILPTLATILLFNNRIDDAVQIAKILYINGKKYDESALVPYYAFCLELIIETSFTLEPADNARRFAENHFQAGVTPDVTAHENKLLLYLLVYYLRTRNVSKVHHWKVLYQVTTDEKKFNVQNILNMFKYTEYELEKLVHVRDASLSFALSEMDKIWTLLEQCRVAADKWQLLKPRYLHYKAYFYRLKDKKYMAKKVLKEAFDLAVLQDNVLEQAWITLDSSAWSGGFSFNAKVAKNISWQLARTYSFLQWSQIMYALPCSIIVEF